MKRLLHIVFIIPFLANSQVAPIKENQIDSLKHLIENSDNDSIVISALDKWSQLVSVSDPGIYCELNEKIFKLCERNLDKRASSKETSHYIKYQGLSSNALGYCHYRIGDYKNAKTYYLKSLFVEKQRSDKKRMARILNNISNIYLRDLNYAKALKCSEVSLKLLEESGDERTISSVLGNIANNYLTQEDYNKALDYFTKGLVKSEEIEYLEGMSKNLNGIGILYEKQHDFDQALKYYEKALSINEKAGNKQWVAENLNNIGNIYNKINEYENAISYYTQSLDFFNKIGNKVGIAHCLNNIGSVYDRQGDEKKALNYYKQSLDFYNEIGDLHEAITTLGNIGQVYISKRDYNKCIEYCTKSLQLAQENNYLTGIRQASYYLYLCYEKKNLFRPSHEMYKLHVETRDSLNNEEIRNTLAQQEYKYAYEKKKLEDDIIRENLIAIERKEKEYQQARVRYMFIIYTCLLVILMTAGFFLFRYRKKRFERELETLKKLKDEKARKEGKDEISSLLVNLGKKIIPVPISDVLFFNARDKYVFLNNKENKSFILDDTIKHLEKSLPDHFVRIHRAYIINTKEIKEITKSAKGKVIFTMNDHEQSKIPSSLGYAQNVESLLMNVKLS